MCPQRTEQRGAATRHLEAVEGGDLKTLQQSNLQLPQGVEGRTLQQAHRVTACDKAAAAVGLVVSKLPPDVRWCAAV